YHPGAWLALGDLGGADFWRNKARVRHVDFTTMPTVTGNTLIFAVLNSYETLDGPPGVICEEAARYTLRILDDSYLLCCESVFTPVSEKITFGDQEEMGFGVRLATPLTVKHGNGRLWNSTGGENEAGTWGKTAAWCAGGGTIENRHVGVVVIPSPANFRPAWFHSRDYGLIVANPFGRKAMTGADDKTMPPDSTPVGKTFTLGFALGVFSVPVDPEGAVKRLFSAYTD
ncbi:MAG: PmoA family protein, partial [Candidatus Hydrogenedentes bacterium]|nr:PmoA family protein [Candidatus Hydrogenedentota bacterium]